MTPDQQLAYKPRLEALARELREAISDTGAATAPVAPDNSIGRLSRMEAIQSQQLALELQRRQQNQLLRVEKALNAIAKGTYGRCARCGEDISQERLEFQPEAFLCIQCASGSGSKQ